MTGKAAIYCRLSEEDRDKKHKTDESGSIQNQKAMLLAYAAEEGWEVYGIYSDDDYTGSGRNRPAFQRLLADAEAHRFDIILCKTQSRFTRELELVEKYIHGLFPVWGIRFIGLADKHYNFCLASADPDCAQLAVAESPIDALSLATLVKRGGGDWRDYSYLSLGGTACRALLQYLRDHPQITQVSLCLDNDKGGMTGMEKAEQAIRDNPELSARVTLIYRNPPPKDYGKDYNEFLCAEVKAGQARRQRQQQTR